jgi:hypothetical protein
MNLDLCVEAVLGMALHTGLSIRRKLPLHIHLSDRVVLLVVPLRPYCASYLCKCIGASFTLVS